MNTKNHIQVSPDHYSTYQYNKKQRFIAYWHQIDEIIKSKPKNILEIGIGNGFVTSYLRNFCLDIVSLDFDKDLCPNVAGNVLELPFSNSSFDVVTCYEVLEHIRFDLFSAALREIFRVCSSRAIISIPDCERYFRVAQLPFLGEIERLLSIPRFVKPVHEFDGQHFWEIGKRGYPLKKVMAIIEREGFVIDSTYRVFENPHHRFISVKVQTS